uniref:Multimerin 2a n=1 Tax=Myripristis murdjan TaxID=586833 RepID=A0A667YTY5_9TELE
MALNLPGQVGVTPPPPGKGGNYPARIRNMCAFVHRQEVNVVVSCGTEKFTIKPQSPCPEGAPNCPLVMYMLSMRPVYRLKKQIVTSLRWRCCPGETCEDSPHRYHVSDAANAALMGGPGGVELHPPGIQVQQQRRDLYQPQNDQQAAAAQPDAAQPDAIQPDAMQPDATQPDAVHHHAAQQHAVQPDDAHHHTAHHHATQPDAAQHHAAHHHATTPSPGPSHQGPQVDAGPLPFPDAPAALPLPVMMELVMSQLQPVLQGVNRSLEQLSRRVGELAADVAQLKSGRPGPEALGGPELTEEEEEESSFDAKLDETFQHIEEVRRQLESHRADMEDRLHSQHAMLHYNLTSFKTDVDMKLKRSQKMLQVSLQAMNTTLAEMRLDQDQMYEDLQNMLAEGRPSVPVTPPPRLPVLQASPPPPQLQPPPQPRDTSALWEAIERLDNKVVNNTVKVNSLVEDMEETSGDIRELRRECKDLEEKIAQTGRNSQIQFMETGLEVEAAKVAVLTRVGELAGNLSQQSTLLQDVEVDVDYLFTAFYKNANSSGDCDCKMLKATIARLEQSVANVTELANENRLTLDGYSEVGAGQWGEASDWEPAVETLQHGLQQVKESLAFEQGRTRTLHHNLTWLSSSLAGNMADVARLQEVDQGLEEEMRHLASSFAALLKDAIRHNDILEMLLGEEVLEFMEWPVQDQEAHSIPVLKERMQHMQEELSEHKLSITSLLGNRPGGRVESPAADQPSSSSHLDPAPGSMKRRSGGPTRERQILHPEGRRLDYVADGGDLWNLGKTVEALGVKVQRLEERPCPASCNNSHNNKEALSDDVKAKLQAEVLWLKRGLEEHLRVFKNVFSNAEVLAGSDATLDLDKLWNLVKNKDGKREKRKGVEMNRGGREGSSGRGSHRSRRETHGES